MGAGDLGEAPLLGSVVSLSHGPLGPLSLTSRVWAAMRWAKPLGMPILMAPSARASEKVHTFRSRGVKANAPLHVWHPAWNLQGQGPEHWPPVQGPGLKPEPSGLPRGWPQRPRKARTWRKQSSGLCRGLALRLGANTYEGHAAATEAGVDVHEGLGHLLTLPAGLQQSLQECDLALPSVAAPCYHHGPLLDHTRQVGREPQHPCGWGQQLARKRQESGYL